MAGRTKKTDANTTAATKYDNTYSGALFLNILSDGGTAVTGPYTLPKEKAAKAVVSSIEKLPGGRTQMHIEVYPLLADGKTPAARAALTGVFLSTGVDLSKFATEESRKKMPPTYRGAFSETKKGGAVIPTVIFERWRDTEGGEQRFKQLRIDTTDGAGAGSLVQAEWPC